MFPSAGNLKDIRVPGRVCKLISSQCQFFKFKLAVTVTRAVAVSEPVTRDWPHHDHDDAAACHCPVPARHGSGGTVTVTVGGDSRRVTA